MLRPIGGQHPCRRHDPWAPATRSCRPTPWRTSGGFRLRPGSLRCARRPGRLFALVLSAVRDHLLAITPRREPTLPKVTLRRRPRFLRLVGACSQVPCARPGRRSDRRRRGEGPGLVGPLAARLLCADREVLRISAPRGLLVDFAAEVNPDCRCRARPAPSHSTFLSSFAGQRLARASVSTPKTARDSLADGVRTTCPQSCSVGLSSTSRPSTPATKDGDSSVLSSRASSTASLTATASGTSST